MSSPWIDFKEIKAKVKIEEVLRFYKVELNVTQGQHIGFCPLKTHTAEQKTPCFSVNLERGIWQCFGCKACGNVLDLAVRLEGLNPQANRNIREVALKLKKTFLDTDGVIDHKPERTRKRGVLRPGQRDFFPASEKKTTVVNQPLDFALKELDPEHPYFQEAGLLPETVAHFGLGYCSRGFHKGRICIPIHSDQGLLAYAGMNLEGNPELTFPTPREHEGTTHEFKRELVLYNAHRLKEPVDHLIVTEHFPSVWWLHQAGLTNVVSVMGAAWSQEQLEHILAKVTLEGSISIVSDGNIPGTRWATGIIPQLAIHRKVSWVKLLEGKRPTDYPPEELVRFFPRESESKAIASPEKTPSIRQRLQIKQITGRQAIVELGKQFPSLSHLRLEAATWDADRLDRLSGKLSSGERYAVQLLLRIWNQYQEWQCGEFDIMNALDSWDKAHRQAFLSWASDPWWL